MNFELLTKVGAMSLLKREWKGRINNRSNEYVIDMVLRDRAIAIVPSYALDSKILHAVSITCVFTPNLMGTSMNGVCSNV